MTDTPHHREEAADRAHGTHGKGDGRERRVDDTPVQSGSEGDHQNAGASDADAKTGQLGDAGWGSAGAGGSVVDKRGPEKK
jgi:hypothetical protein